MILHSAITRCLIRFGRVFKAISGLSSCWLQAEDCFPFEVLASLLRLVLLKCCGEEKVVGRLWSFSLRSFGLRCLAGGVGCFFVGQSYQHRLICPEKARILSVHGFALGWVHGEDRQNLPLSNVKPTSASLRRSASEYVPLIY